jgi:hypothetical protein
MDSNQVRERISGELLGTKRKGVDNVIRFLEESDFFSAPASSTHHLNVVGGLACHSWNVFEVMSHFNRFLPECDEYGGDTVVLVSLLHDLCKTEFYKVNGYASKTRPFVVREDRRGLGHGEDSLCLLLELGLELSLEEKKAIRWHMGPFDHTGLKNQGDWNDLSTLLFISDYYATTFLEKKQEVKNGV